MKIMHLLAPAAALTAVACGASTSNNVSISSQSSSFQSSQELLNPTLEMPDQKQLMAILLASDDVIPERRDDDCGVVIETLPEHSLGMLVDTLYSAAKDVEGGCELSYNPRVYSCHLMFSSSHGNAADWIYHLDVDIDHDHSVIVDSAQCAGTP